MFGYKFYESRSIITLSYGYHPNFTSINHFLEERVVAELKKVFLLFSPKLDTNFMNLGQIAHKLWIFSLFFLFTTFGDERVAKN